MNRTCTAEIILLLFVSFCVNFSYNASLNLNKYEKFVGDQGLYTQKDDVEILTIGNFKNAILNSDRAWLVEFYNSWCGFCQRFAPSWTEFATNVRGWKDLVVVAAIDCNNEDNHPVCREFEVMGYPTLRYYNEKFNEKTLGANMPRGITADDHRHDLLNKMIGEQREGRGKHFPNLLPYIYTDVMDIFKNTSENVKYAVLIIQEPQAYEGPEVALDLHKISSLVVRYALSNNSDLVKNLGVTAFPSAFIVDKDYTVKDVSPVSRDRVGIKNSVIMYLKEQHIPLDLEQSRNFDDNSQQEKQDEYNSLAEKIQKMGDTVFQVDLETALRYSLKREVGVAKEITGEKLEALNKYLDVLVKYFPFGKNGKKLLSDLNNYVKTAPKVEGANIFQSVKQAEKEENVFSSNQVWLGCKGSSGQFRGYPCGLWKLFHYLTVNAAQDVDSRGDNPRVVLEAMHGYIKNFFGCVDCSEHFQEMAARRGLSKVSSFNDSVIWLWDAHNEVNKRLSGDLTEDPKFPKVQFPSKQNCPKCRNVDESWNIPKVLDYLKHVYSNININYMGADMNVIHSGFEEGQRNSSDSSGGIFKTLDTKGVQKKDVQIQARPPGKSVTTADDQRASSRATNLWIKDKASHLLAMFCFLTVWAHQFI